MFDKFGGWVAAPHPKLTRVVKLSLGFHFFCLFISAASLCALGNLDRLLSSHNVDVKQRGEGGGAGSQFDCVQRDADL